MSNETLIKSFTSGRFRLMKMARSLLGNPDDAEDALQEAFCRLWPRAETLLTEQDADRMAMTTVKNISIDQLKRKSPLSTTLKGEVEIAAEDESRRADNRNQLEIVDEIVSQHLTPLQQRIFRAHDVDGLSYEEIAHQEQMLEPAVRKQLSRARNTIREYYQKFESHERK